MIRAVIFDWSGTLYNDYAAVVARVERLFPHAPFVRLIFYHPLLRPLRGLLTRANIGLPMRFPGDDASSSASNLFPAVKPTLQFLKAKRVKSIILSAQAPAIIQHVLDCSGLNAAVDEVHGGILHKGVFLKRWLRQNQFQREHVIFVSDLPEDIADVQPAGVIICAAAWGYDSKRRLQRVQPHAILNQLDDLRGFLARYSASKDHGAPSGKP